METSNRDQMIFSLVLINKRGDPALGIMESPILKLSVGDGVLNTLFWIYDREKRIYKVKKFHKRPNNPICSISMHQATKKTTLCQ